VDYVIYQSALECYKKPIKEVNFGVTLILYDKINREIDLEKVTFT